MQLMQLATAPRSTRDRVFRYSPARALCVAFTVICVSGGLVLAGRERQSGLAYYVAGMLVLGLLLMRRMVLARLRPSNWLVRMSDEGLFVQFRSYLNYHFPSEDPTVVFIPYQEIRSARLVRQRREIPYTDLGQVRRVSVESRWLVECELSADSAPLAQALADERVALAPKVARWYGSTSVRYRHYPVRMASPTCIQLEWGVVPGAPVLLDALRRRTEIVTPVEISHDDVTLEGTSREEQEKRLLELAETGQILAAIEIARKLYSYDLTEAQAFVEGLHSGKGTGADPSRTPRTPSARP